MPAQPCQESIGVSLASVAADAEDQPLLSLVGSRLGQWYLISSQVPEDSS
jgi:hypothetical protein